MTEAKAHWTMAKKSREPFSCPVCGEEVPADAKSCPECGACDRSGWSEGAAIDGLNLPDEDFDYDRYVEEEMRKVWIVVTVLLIVATTWGLVGGCFHVG